MVSSIAGQAHDGELTHQDLYDDHQATPSGTIGALSDSAHRLMG
jgi:hypothetical protein